MSFCWDAGISYLSWILVEALLFSMSWTSLEESLFEDVMDWIITLFMITGQMMIQIIGFQIIVCALLGSTLATEKIYANKGLASTWRKWETMTKTAETACLTAANRTIRQGETILEGYCASGKGRRSFFVTEGGKLAKSHLSFNTCSPWRGRGSVFWDRIPMKKKKNCLCPLARSHLKLKNV